MLCRLRFCCVIVAVFINRQMAEVLQSCLIGLECIYQQSAEEHEEYQQGDQWKYFDSGNAGEIVNKLHLL